jgi:hypothetical protein
VLGGQEDEGEPPLRIVEVYDITDGNWSTLSSEMKVGRAFFAAAVCGDSLYAIGGASVDARHTIEMLALPPLLPWTPTQHTTFPHSFQRAVYTLVCCFARTNTLPDDVLFRIMWLLDLSAFKHQALT